MVPYPLAAARSADQIDSNSRDADDVPNIQFVDSEQHFRPILVYRCINAVGVCSIAKEWHFKQYGNHGTPDLLRMDSQDLHTLDNTKEGTLLVLEGACGDLKAERAYDIMAVLMPGDSNIRFFYSILPYTGLVKELFAANVIRQRRGTQQIAPASPAHRQFHKTYHTQGRDMHCRIFAFISEAFVKALQIPHSKDYINAMQMTDFSPDISRPSTALQRIQHLAGEQQFPVAHGANIKDLSEDRYLKELHEAERELASVCEINCAEYLLIKRSFFKDFYEEVMRSEKKLGEMVLQGRGKDRKEKMIRVRSEAQHVQWFERVYEWGSRRARRMVGGWEVLGLLDERMILPWVRAGGMLAVSELVDEVDDDEDEWRKEEEGMKREREEAVRRDDVEE